MKVFNFFPPFLRGEGGGNQNGTKSKLSLKTNGFLTKIDVYNNR